jgi:hypothetical protein
MPLHLPDSQFAAPQDLVCAVPLLERGHKVIVHGLVRRPVVNSRVDIFWHGGHRQQLLFGLFHVAHHKLVGCDKVTTLFALCVHKVYMY